jgi:hypothetical protein
MPVGDRIAQLLRGADLFIGVVGDEMSPTVMYEAGFASGLGKRVVLFLPPASVELPVDMSGGLYFRLDPSSSGVDFAVEQALSTPPIRRSRPKRKSKILPYAPDLAARLALLDQVGGAASGVAIESLVQGILSVVGVQSVSADSVSKAGDARRQWDLVAWDGDLPGSASNPVLIEVKKTLPTSETWYRDLQHRADQTPGSAVLVLYWRGEPLGVSGHVTSARINIISIRELVERLQTAPFADVVRRARPTEI